MSEHWGIRTTGALLAAAGAPAARAQALGTVPHPLPIISEVLFDVPENADPTQDGRRHAVGDEFIEIVNPHDKPINIGGFFICDRAGAESSKDPTGIRWRFPQQLLQPGEIALVFNGYLANLPGAVGTTDAAPTRKNEKFGGAWVFTMNNSSPQRAFSNASDVCVLVRPDGKPIEFISWGAQTPESPKFVIRAQHFKSVPGCSVQRVGHDEEFEPHKDIDGKIMSPGRIPKRAAPADQTTAPAPGPAPAPAPPAGAPAVAPAGDAKPPPKR